MPVSANDLGIASPRYLLRHHDQCRLSGNFGSEIWRFRGPSDLRSALWRGGISMPVTRQPPIYFDRDVFAVLTRGTARTRHDTLISSDTAASDWPWGSKTRPGRTRLGRLLL